MRDQHRTRRFLARVQRSINKRKKEDRRGKHTKESREKIKSARAAYLRSLRDVRCSNCSGTQFDHTADGANLVCNRCGFVDEERSMPDAIPLADQLENLGSCTSIYRHRNYFAERMRQFNNTEPRFSTLEKSQIYAVQSFLERNIGPEWSPGLLSKHKFGQICRILDQVRPGQRWRQKLERWHQAKIAISGRCDYQPDLPPSELTHQMKVIFDGFAYIFEKFFRGHDEFGRNIPKLDLVCLILMYNISKESLWRWGWFFMNSQIWWESQSTLRDYARCEEIINKTNECLVALEPRKIVRRETMQWFRHNKLELPSLNELRSRVPHDYDREDNVPYTLTIQ